MPNAGVTTRNSIGYKSTEFDLFISHASEDKDTVARPLSEELERRGYRVWFDERQIVVGDSLSKSIERGLTEARFGAVILSKSFFGKDWTKREFEALVSREKSSGGKVIIPVWHGVSLDDVAKYSQDLADKLAVDTKLGIPSVADFIGEVLGPASMLGQENLTTLKGHLGKLPLHLQLILDGAVASFTARANPLRFAHTAHALTELLRELLSAISPDFFIQRCLWFESSKSEITRREQVLFAVYSYLDPEHFPTNFGEEVHVLIGDIEEQSELLSVLSRVTPAILATPELKAIEAFDRAIALFLHLFVAIESARKHLRESLQEQIQGRLDDLFTSEFFDELDALSSHTRPQYAEDVEIKIDDIGEDAITFSGTGSVLCKMQYGSDGDCRRGDGLEFDDCYPFTFTGEAQTADPRNVTVDVGDVTVDTSSFYE